ncbi:hypothetical protein DFH07DRAFT_264874 [Mycena maculata]|uniref:Uncharacterized protein n=1 Tax=Mycena maculata TaxID=230809 RepID=A0AAD7HN28_9AGAR|nr:hypothetical protein DFH07DRAFT_264874 [Mycena maculata]
MSVSIDIVPLTPALDMYGEPDKSSAFSLSGVVSIALTSPHSVFERRRPARVILQSVLLTFHGQTEVITTTLGYSPLSLCSISRELAPSAPLELTNEGHEETDEPSRWNIVFDLPIPGWLPASHDFAPGDFGAQTRYFLHAAVRFVVVEDQRGTSSFFTTFCSPFRSRDRSIETHKTITLRRFVEPPMDEATPPETINYLLSPPIQSFDKGFQIPLNVLSKIQVLASVPKYVDVCEDHLPFTLRLRTKDLEDADCRRLQITNFKVDVVQEEKCRRSTRSSEYQARYPVPSQSSQPPNKPLFNAHHLSDMYWLGLYAPPDSKAKGMTSFTSLLPPGEPGVYHLCGDHHIFAEDAVKDTATWYTLETSISFVHVLPPLSEGTDWEGALRVRPSAQGPLYDVSHSLKLTVCCTYSMPDSDKVATADMTFCVPLAFGRIAPPLPSRDILPALLHSMLPDGAYPPLPSLLPFAANLPAYSQLFDSQGNRKMDATPLPLYTPRSSSDSPVEPPSSNEKQDELHAMTL